MLKSAMDSQPSHPDIAKSQEALNQGKVYLDDAKYDKAFQSFRESMRLSESVANPRQAETKAAAKRPPPPPLPTPVENPIQNSETVAMPAPIPAPAPVQKAEKVIAPPRALPKDVLAKYLASKKGPPVSNPAPQQLKAAPKAVPAKPTMSAPTTSLHEKPAPAAAPNLVPETLQERIEAPDPTLAESTAPAVAPPPPPAAPAPVIIPPPPALDDEPAKPLENVAGNLIEGQAASAAPKVDEVVKAPAKPIDKILVPVPKEKPKVEKVDKKQIIKAPAETTKPGAPGAAPERGRTKIPGSLTFSPNDSSIQAESMMNLDQTSKFLLDNPSSSIVFQGIVGAGESAALVDSRFESIRSYLVGKGVPEDQVRLDQKRRGGNRGEFEMYVIEH